MKSNFHTLRVKQLEKHLQPFFAAQSAHRPKRGWINAIREVNGLTLRDMAQRTGKHYQAIAQLEKSEVQNSITVKSLMEVAAAMDCELVYALVPKHESLRALVKNRLMRSIAPMVRAVEHSMVLEGQASSDIEAKIEDEAERMLEQGKKGP